MFGFFKKKEAVKQVEEKSKQDIWGYKFKSLIDFRFWYNLNYSLVSGGGVFMGILILALILFALYSFIKDGNGIFKSIAMVVVGLTVCFLAPMLLIPVVIIVVVATAKGY